jgi:transcriptional regulator with XRE-family HTH domain
MSQEALARRLRAKGLRASRALIARWERGLGDPGTGHIVEAARLFGVSADYLLGLSEDPKGRALVEGREIPHDSDLYRTIRLLLESGDLQDYLADIVRLNLDALRRLVRAPALRRKAELLIGMLERGELEHEVYADRPLIKRESLEKLTGKRGRN